LTNPEGCLLPELRLRLEEAFWALLSSRETVFSRVLKSFFTVEKRPTSCWSLALNSVSLTVRDNASAVSVVGASAETNVFTGADTAGATSTTDLAFFAGRDLDAAADKSAAATTGTVTETGVAVCFSAEVFAALTILSYIHTYMFLF